VRKTSVELPDDLDALMRRGAASVGQSPSQFVREAVLLRCAVSAGEVTDEMAAIAQSLAEAAQRRPPRAH
jgi:predicted transcriptional regulator